ncbi:PilZ domain-containing protein [Sphingomonas abietis]|uniref:PilZ domain-containing protein n=1 Tax=Sphingomonas abietis TaxID=3012344 RepID=A0ABY7NJB5_9SPHN|nr:PilZ domain-containing protein [Sphingomonas abietis]WBO21627.1 PilZ domain-containing protein [Sphingomonas abietis]
MQAVIEVRRDDPRRESRHFAHRDGEIEPAGSNSVSGVVTDLSRSGFRIVVDEPLAAESVVWLKVGGHGPFMARVVWYDGTAAGCEFAGKLQPELVERLLQA